jgi:hypothetical protein
VTQAIFCSKDEFSQRTNALAKKYNLVLRDLPPVIGFKDRAFWGYRTGEYKVSKKANDKLIAAEIAAGLRYGASAANRTILEIPERNIGRLDRDRGMVSESSHSDPIHSWEDVVSYVRTLKQLDLTPDEVIDLLQREYPLRLGKKT